MDGQMFTVTLAILLALGYIGRTVYLSLTGHGTGCSSGCGCCPSTAKSPEASDANRRRIALPQV